MPKVNRAEAGRDAGGKQPQQFRLPGRLDLYPLYLSLGCVAVGLKHDFVLSKNFCKKTTLKFWLKWNFFYGFVLSEYFHEMATHDFCENRG